MYIDNFECQRQLSLLAKLARERGCITIIATHAAYHSAVQPAS